MKIETKPWAGGFLAALIYLVACTWVLALGCASSLTGMRTTPMQYVAAVRIDIICITPNGGFISGGSGVIVDARHVLTAGHVAHEGLCAFDVTDIDGAKRSMYVKEKYAPIDLATLEISTGVKPFKIAPVLFGPRPHVGTRVCESPAWPRFSHKCGEVQPYTNTPGDIVFGVTVDHGNSGSGLYDETGRLVGIVTHLVECSNGQYCEGKAASLEGHLAELLP